MSYHNHTALTTNCINIDYEKSVIDNAIKALPECEACPMIILTETFSAAARLEQPVDSGKYSPLPPMLNLIEKAHNWGYQGTHAEDIKIFPTSNDDPDYDFNNYLFSNKLKEAIDFLKSQGTSNQIIFESLLQAAFDYCIRISGNSNTFTSLLLNAVNDVFRLMSYFELDRLESKKIFL
jgi:hypothetical protein